MKEALTAIVDYGFKEMRLHMIQVLIDPRNVPSIRLVESPGFKKEGVIRESTHFRGRFFDSISCSLLSEEWSRL